MTEVYKSNNPTILVIFGITGDLSRRKLLPALFHLHRKKLLPKFFQVVGFSRRELTNDKLREEIGNIIGIPPENERETLESFKKLFVYLQGSFEEKEGYNHLAESLGRKDNEWRVCSNKLFYLAVPPNYYKDIFKYLDTSGLTEPCSPEEGWTRVIVEKPFGSDLKTAEELEMILSRRFKEEQIYRIDHYLGKETVQNILALRFSNTFLEPALDNRGVESIHIRVFEKIGIEGRGEFYDKVGALRDVGQNHLLQLLALFTMDRPKTFDALGIRPARLAALASLRILKNPSVRGQYEGYRAEKNVDPKSETETYFKVTASLASSRWKGVPIYLESGKRMKEKRAEVLITFKHPSPCLCPPDRHTQNVLRYSIEPEEGIFLSFYVKRPGTELTIEEQDFSFDYGRAYDKELFIDPYEKLLLDTFVGSQMLFVSTDEIKASWKFIDAISGGWRRNKTPLVSYKPGTLPQADL